MRDPIDLAKDYRWTLVGVAVAVLWPEWTGRATGVFIALFAFTIETRNAARYREVKRRDDAGEFRDG